MVVASFVLEHVSELHVAARNIARMLKPNGIFLFSGINRTLMTLFIVSIGFQNILRKIPQGTLRWNKFVRPGELEAALKQGGTLLKPKVWLDVIPIGSCCETTCG